MRDGTAKQQICIALCSIHVLALAICTYMAAVDIKSILFTGWICAATGIAMGMSAIACKQPKLTAAGFSTPILAVILFVLEAFVLQLGPSRAALPFCTLFIFNQVIATLLILVELRIMTAPPGARARQITINTLLVLIASFSVFFAIARRLLEREHNSLMALALGLGGLTFVGLTFVVYTAIVNRISSQNAA